MDSKIEEAKKLFAQKDTNNDGALNAEEIKNLCKDLDWDSTTVPAAIAAYDNNKDEKITVDEFVEYYTMKLTNNKEALFKKVFEKIDQDHDENVNLQEMIYFGKLIGENLTEAEAAEQLKDVDVNNDGKINFDELFSIFQDCEL